MFENVFIFGFLIYTGWRAEDAWIWKRHCSLLHGNRKVKVGWAEKEGWKVYVLCGLSRYHGMKNKITKNGLCSSTFFVSLILKMFQTTMFHPVIPLSTNIYHSFITYSWTIQSSLDLYEIITLFFPFRRNFFFSYINSFFHSLINDWAVRVIYKDSNNYVFINHRLRKYTYLKESTHDFYWNLGWKSICSLSQSLSSVEEHMCLLSFRDQASNFSHCPM